HGFVRFDVKAMAAGPDGDLMGHGQYYLDESGYNFTMNRRLLGGCGDIPLRALPRLARKYQVFGLVRASAQADRIAALGAIPLTGDLDEPASLHALSAGSDLVLHL